MASKPSQMIHAFLKFFNFNQRLSKFIASPNFGKEEKVKPSKKMIKRYDIEIKDINHEKMYIWHSKAKKKHVLIFYVHGGAFVKRQNNLHFNLFTTIVKKTGFMLIAPNYPLVPHGHVDDIYEHLELCYEEVKLLYPKHKIIFMGDSAGGGLALGLTQRLHQKEGIKDQSVILISPWLDISMSHPMIKDIQKNDPILNHQTLKDIGQMYKGSHDYHDKIVNPLIMPFKGIKQVYVWTGTYDILYADAIMLEEKCIKQDIDIKMHVYEEMLHTWIYFGVPESKMAMKEIIETVLHLSEEKT